MYTVGCWGLGAARQRYPSPTAVDRLSPSENLAESQELFAGPGAILWVQHRGENGIGHALRVGLRVHVRAEGCQCHLSSVVQPTGSSPMQRGQPDEEQMQSSSRSVVRWTRIISQAAGSQCGPMGSGPGSEAVLAGDGSGEHGEGVCLVMRMHLAAATNLCAPRGLGVGWSWPRLRTDVSRAAALPTRPPPPGAPSTRLHLDQS